MKKRVNYNILCYSDNLSEDIVGLIRSCRKYVENIEFSFRRCGNIYSFDSEFVEKDIALIRKLTI